MTLRHSWFKIQSPVARRFSRQETSVWWARAQARNARVPLVVDQAIRFPATI